MEVTLPTRADGGLRRAADLAGATLLLTATLPLLAGAALAVLMTSGRPIFFGHVRVGRDGLPFRCWKLRTMEVGAEARLREDMELHRLYVENGFKIPADDDPRLTPLGRHLRRRFLDELPQLFNVLNGTMSLVGPRPLVRDELTWYGDAADELLAVRPGIVGEWTSRGPARPDYPERAELELDYVRGRTAGRDLRILARSAWVVLRGHLED